MPGTVGKSGGLRPGAGRKAKSTRTITIHVGEQFYIGGGYGIATATAMDRKHLTLTLGNGEIITLVR